MGNSMSGSSDNILTPPADYVVPSFPSLYNPALEFRQPSDANGTNDSSIAGVSYLYYSTDIYRFCLYWSLILYVPMYFVCGFHSLLVHMMTSKRRLPSKVAVIIPLVYVLAGLVFGVVSSAIVGYALAAVYSVGLFRMSTWVPLLWSMVISLVTIIGSYSTIVAIL